MRRDQILVVAALCLLAACKKKMSGIDVEKQLTAYFADTGAVEKVTCPAGVDPAAGTTFECKLKFASGDEFTVVGTVTAIQGDRVGFDFKIVEPAFDPAAVGAWIVKNVEQQKGIKPVVDCGAPRKPKAQETCTLTAPDGTTATALVDVGADGKPTHFIVQ